MALQDLTGKTALVTGAAKRIGRHIALALAAEGMNVVIHYRRSEEEAQELRRTLMESGVQAWTIQADFRERDQLDGLIARVVAMAGELHLLVNNAAGFPPATVPELSFEGLLEPALVDAWAPFSLSRQFAEVVGRGSIIDLIDARVDGFDFRHAGYILAKHVLLAMMRMQALQYAPDVTINGIMPGLILPPPDKDEAYLNSLTHTVPLQRHGDPDDIAAAAVFLATSTFMTGAVIHIDGGRHLQAATDDPSSHPHQ